MNISFEIDDTENCLECSKTEGVFGLWIKLQFVEDMKPQMNINEAKADEILPTNINLSFQKVFILVKV